jgi:hypothetical protein
VNPALALKREEHGVDRDRERLDSSRRRLQSANADTRHERRDANPPHDRPDPRASYDESVLGRGFRRGVKVSILPTDDNHMADPDVGEETEDVCGLGDHPLGEPEIDVKGRRVRRCSCGCHVEIVGPPGGVRR